MVFSVRFFQLTSNYTLKQTGLNNFLFILNIHAAFETMNTSLR